MHVKFHKIGASETVGCCGHASHPRALCRKRGWVTRRVASCFMDLSRLLPPWLDVAGALFGLLDVALAACDAMRFL